MTVMFRGRPACTCLAEWLPVMEQELLDLKVIKHSIDIYQLIGGAKASAGYHLYGGNADVAQQSTTALRAYRNAGGAAFPRDSRDGMTPHCHIALKGCPHMKAGPNAQVRSLENGRNGLVNNKMDRGPRDGIEWPLRSYKEGIKWMKARQAARRKTVTPFPSDVTDWVDAKATYQVVTPALGYAPPGVPMVPQVLRPAGYIVKSVGHTTKNRIYEATENGVWYRREDMRKVDDKYTNTNPPPLPGDPAPEKTHPLVTATQNAINLRMSPSNVKKVGDWQKGSSFDARVPLMVGQLPKDLRSVGFQEVGPKSASNSLDDDLGERFGGQWDNWNEGDLWDISQSGHWNAELDELVEAGRFRVTPAGPGSSHNVWGWVHLKDKSTGIERIEVDVHAIAKKGASYDTQRERQCDDGFAQVKALQAAKGGIAVIVRGDFNSPTERKTDGPGKAAKKHGFTDMEWSSCEVVNPKYPSLNGKDLTPTLNSEQYDRIFYRGPITPVKRQVMVPLVGGKIKLPSGIWYSDHWAVAGWFTVGRP